MKTTFDICGFEILNKELKVYHDKFSNGIRLILSRTPRTEYYLEEITTQERFQELMYEFVDWNLNYVDGMYELKARVDYFCSEPGFLISNRDGSLGNAILVQVKKIEETISTHGGVANRQALNDIFNNHFIYTNDQMDRLYVSHWMLNMEELNLIEERHQFDFLVSRVTEVTSEIIDECSVIIGRVGTEISNIPFQLPKDPA